MDIKYTVGEFALGLFQRKPLPPNIGNPMLRLMGGECIEMKMSPLRRPLVDPCVRWNIQAKEKPDGYERSGTEGTDNLVDFLATLDTSVMPKPEFNRGTTL